MRYQIQSWITPEQRRLPRFQKLCVKAGMWRLVWEDGFSVFLLRTKTGMWRSIAELTFSPEDHQNLSIPYPDDARTKTRRELVQILVAWRERYLENQSLQSS